MVEHLVAVTVGGGFTDVGRSLREAFFMFWETLWPLVLGFGLSGAVQAFVSHEQMQSRLGDHRPAAVARASGYGMVSSSCSYAASAMAKSLFQKGADFISAMVFMFASTNLVIEMGIVLAILLGWQFTAAEFVGGPIMIVLLATLGGLLLRRGLIAVTRRRVTERARDHEHDHILGAGVSEQRQYELEHQPWRQKLTSPAAWADSAGYTVADLKMLRTEMAIGYVVAGFLAVLVPVRAWNALFVHGHGVWTSIENAAIGPVIAFFSFVCSIGNVPLAAALWKGGISFGGVVSFIFADLVAAPLVLIYRRYYGGALTWRLVGLFWAVMASAGLAVQAIFSAAGLVPTHRPTQIVSTSFRWNYATVLNLVFLALFAYLFWLYRNRDRLGGGVGYSIDPVCGMQVRTATAPARSSHRGRRHWFCSDHCADRFRRDPNRYRRHRTIPDPAHALEGEEPSRPTSSAAAISSAPPSAL
jgi:uncharacterized membrane protein YraQ (UPF0718 family)/YHS domain-containing protein